jgi:hypothetical protein
MPTETERASMLIRAALRATPGTNTCGTGGCQVIAQGGLKGLAAHRRIVHYADSWIERKDIEDD